MSPCDPQLGRLLHHEIHALTARDALGKRDRKRRLALGAVLLADHDRDRIVVYRMDAGGVLTALAVEDDERIADPQAQHAHHVAGSAAGELDARLRGERRFDVDARQSHVARSMPSRATSAMRSISCGVTTYGGMKYTTLPIGRSSTPRVSA